MAKCIPINNGIGSIPSVGLGTWTAWGQLGSYEDVEAAVSSAIDAGYRHIDTAWIYKTQGAIGKALVQKVKDGVITREEMFITTKVWCTHHSPTLMKQELLDSLKSLQTNYVDMVLMHFPVSFKDQDLTSEDLFPGDEKGKAISGGHALEDVWKAMEECQKTGFTKNIGLSNCNSKQLERIMKSCTIKPANMQVEVSPYFSNIKLRDLCMSLGVVVTAHSPFGAPTRTWAKDGEPNAFEEEVIKTIALKKDKTVAQVILRSHIQRGLVVVPKSINPDRIQENIQVFDFTLTEDEMQAIGTVDRNFRTLTGSGTFDWTDLPEYPFNDPF